MRIRPAHVVLLLLAIPPMLIGAGVILRGIFGRSRDASLLGYFLVGIPLLTVAVALVAVAVCDARRQRR